MGHLIDTFTQCGSGGSACNNFVRIQHPNSEWTKYTHFVTGSVVAEGRFEGEIVQAGIPLGDEGDVGATSTSSNSTQYRNRHVCGGSDDCMKDVAAKRCFMHLHFEVRATGPTSKLRIPLICGITNPGDTPNNIYKKIYWDRCMG